MAYRSKTLLLSSLLFLTPALRANDAASPEQSGTVVVDNRYAHCKVAGTSYETPFDCAVATAKALAEANHQPVEIRMGAGTFETKTGLQMVAASRYTIHVHGAGKGEFGGGTVLRLVAPLTTGVITYPFLQRANGTTRGSSYWSNLNLQGFTVDANGKAPMCFDLYALRVAHLSDLSCMGAIGTHSWMRIGGYSESYGGTVPQGYNGGGFQVMASDIFLYHNGAAPEAEVTAQVSNGVITGYQIQNAGHFRESPVVPIFLKGPDGATPPCTKMPQEVRGHVVADASRPGFYKLASITQKTNGEGCTLPIAITVADNPAAAYGFEIEATDSTFTDLTDDSVGRIAGIEDRVSGKALFIHPHVWNTWGGMELWGGETVITPEFDSQYGYGVHFRYGSGSVVINPTFVYLRHSSFDSVADFLLSPSASNMSITDQQCETPDPNRGYTQFAGARGMLDLGSAVAATSRDAAAKRVFPVGFRAVDIASCGVTSKPSTGVSVTTAPMSGTLQERRLSWSGSVAASGKSTSFLLAELPATGEQSMPSLRATLFAAAAGAAPTLETFLLSSAATCPTSATGSATVPSSIQTYSQADGTVRVYVRVELGASATVLLDLIQNAETHLEPAPPEAVPAGTLLFDSSRCTHVGATPIQ